MAFRSSRSIPEQNALPEPVRIRTRAELASTSSNALSKSPIIMLEMALRFSGRFSVIVAMAPEISSFSV